MAGTLYLSNHGLSISNGSLAAQVVSSAGTYDLVATISTLGVNKLTLSGIVAGTGPLTGLQLNFCAAQINGTEITALQDADFSTATDTLLRTLGLATPTNIATGSKFQITVDLFGVIGQVMLRAKSSAGATVAIEAYAQ